MVTFDPPSLQCHLCNSRDIHEYHRDVNDIRIYLCNSCGVQFMNPQYSDVHLADYYSRYTADEPQWDEPLRYGHNFYLEILERFVPGKGSLLDIGSGKGHLLSVALQRGWKARGYEIDCDLAKKLTMIFGVQVHCGSFADVGWGKGQFDAAVMHHVLEHLKNPVVYLEAIHKTLREGGFLFIVLPNIHSLSSRFKFFIEKMQIRKTNVGAYYDTTHHLWYFTPGTLRRFLSHSGFDVRYMRSGHRVRPRQTPMRRFIMRNITERNLWHSTFLCIAQKRSPDPGPHA